MGVTLVMVSLGALVTMGVTRAQGVHSPVLGAATAVRADYTVHSHNKKVSFLSFHSSPLVIDSSIHLL